MDNVVKYLLNILKINDYVVAAISGGPDSMFLLTALLKTREKLKINIICAHVNHNLREESAKEYTDLEDFCKVNNIIFEGMKIENYSDDNFHNQARTIRYNFFKDLTKKYDAKFLLTAHHGDDLIETILMRIVRGASLKGYAGFSKELDMEGYKIIRPLIELTKEEITDYCDQNGIKYAIDKSNFKDVYTRNRFRKYIVPYLKNEDKNVHKKFLKFNQTLLEYNNYVDSKVAMHMKDIYVNNVLNISEFLKLEKLIQNKIIYNILEKIYQDDLMILTDANVELILDLINSKKANAYICLPNNIKAIKYYNNLEIKAENNAEDYELIIDETVFLPNKKIIEKINNSNETDNFICYLDSKELKMPLKVRNKKDGDKIEILGLNGKKLVSDIFINSKIKKEDRNSWPVVVDSNDVIVWLPGLKKSKFDKTKTQKYDIILKYH